MKCELPSVAGRMESTHMDFQAACCVMLAEIQQDPNCDNRIIHLLCEAVRCSRECCEIAGGSESKREIDRLRTQLKSVEAERDRYKVALERLLVGDHVGTPINRGCGAMSVIEDALSWTDAEVDQFMKEWDEGKHQLSPEDERALEKSKVKLFERIKSTLNPTNKDVM